MDDEASPIAFEAASPTIGRIAAMAGLSAIATADAIMLPKDLLNIAPNILSKLDAFPVLDVLLIFSLFVGSLYILFGMRNFCHVGIVVIAFALAALAAYGSIFVSTFLFGPLFAYAYYSVVPTVACIYAFILALLVWLVIAIASTGFVDPRLRSWRRVALFVLAIAIDLILTFTVVTRMSYSDTTPQILLFTSFFLLGLGLMVGQMPRLRLTSRGAP